MLRVVNKMLLLVMALSLSSGHIVSGQEIQEVIPTPEVIITEVKVRNDASGYDEYIEISNTTNETVNLSDYIFEYHNASGVVVREPLGGNQLGPMAQHVFAKKPLQILNSSPLPFTSLTDGGGKLRIIDLEGLVIDEIGWTSTASMASAPEVTPPTIACTTSGCIGKSIQRLVVSSDSSIEYGNWALLVADPVSVQLITVVSVPDEPPLDPDSNEEPPVELPVCVGLLITELLPNPAGSDTGNEYIEIYNPTSVAVELRGCGLKINGSGKEYSLGNGFIAPSSYLSISDTTSGLTLPNSAGGTVWLFNEHDDIDTISYPAALADDVSWSLIEGVWQISYAPSAGASNVRMPIKPCPPGQYRNEQSNRCSAVELASSVTTLSSCKSGQVRNPITNRCRNIVSSSAAVLVPCKANQERNPETNRCRNITSRTALVPCDPGQERSLETNRCRKVNGGETLASVTDVKTEAVKPSSKWWIAGGVLIFAIGYAVYEWRHELRRLIFRKSM